MCTWTVMIDDGCMNECKSKVEVQRERERKLSGGGDIRFYSRN